jgi:hypothetical protein
VAERGVPLATRGDAAPMPARALDHPTDVVDRARLERGSRARVDDLPVVLRRGRTRGVVDRPRAIQASPVYWRSCYFDHDLRFSGKAIQRRQRLDSGRCAWAAVLQAPLYGWNPMTSVLRASVCSTPRRESWVVRRVLCFA